MRGLDGKPLPKVGDVFAFPLTKKLSSFCWIVRALKPEYRYSSKLKKWMTSPDLVIACATWVGEGDPTEDDLAERTVLKAFQGSKKKPLLRCDCDAPPRIFRKVGHVTRPNVSDKHPDNFSGFKGLREEAIEQWLHDHDRQALLERQREAAEAEKREQLAEEAANKQIGALVTKRKRATRATIAKTELLPDWPGERRHRTLLEGHLRSLIALLRAAKDPAAKRAAIATVVEAINTWNDRALVIETEEREALATAIDDIGRAFGMRGKDLAGDVRDW